MNPTKTQASPARFTLFACRYSKTLWAFSACFAALSILLVTAGCSPSKPANTGLVIQKDPNVMGLPGNRDGYRFLATEPVDVLLRARAVGQPDVTVSGSFTNGQTVIFGYRVLPPPLNEAPQSNVCEICVGWTTEKVEAGGTMRNTLPKTRRLVFPVNYSSGAGVEMRSFGGAYNPPVPSTTRLLRYYPSKSEQNEQFSITLELTRPKQP